MSASAGSGQQQLDRPAPARRASRPRARRRSWMTSTARMTLLKHGICGERSSMGIEHAMANSDRACRMVSNINYRRQRAIPQRVFQPCQSTCSADTMLCPRVGRQMRRCEFITLLGGRAETLPLAARAACARCGYPVPRVEHSGGTWVTLTHSAVPPASISW
jgi:hypothetical protein